MQDSGKLEPIVSEICLSNYVDDSATYRARCLFIGTKITGIKERKRKLN